MAKIAKRKALVAPQNKEELNEFVRELGELQRQQDELNTALARKLDAVTAETTKLLQPLVDRAQMMFDGIVAYTSGHRNELTEGVRKTIVLPAGLCNWRLSPPAVKLTKPDEVLKAVEQLKLTQFIRTKQEIDREQMLKEPKLAVTIAGVRIEQEEVFTVKPHSVRAEITRDSLKKGRPKAAKKTKVDGEAATDSDGSTAVIAHKKPR